MNMLKTILRKIVQKKETKSKTPFFTKEIFQGDNFNIGDYTYGKPTVLFTNANTRLVVGKFCSIAANVTVFLGGNHRTDWLSTYPFNILNSDFPAAKEINGHPATKGDVIIGNDVWIGRNATILSGILIGDGAVIAANSVVCKNIGDYEVWGGNPAKFIRKRFDDDVIKELKEIKWWDLEVNSINKIVTYLCSGDIRGLKEKIKLELNE